MILQDVEYEYFFSYDSLHGPYILAKRQKWQIDTVDRLFPCQLYRVTLFLTPMANNDTAL